MLRLKVKRQEEERISKIKGLIEMYPINVPGSNSDNYYPIGGSSLPSNWTSPTIDPRIQKTKGLFEMFQIDR